MLTRASDPTKIAFSRAFSLGAHEEKRGQLQWPLRYIMLATIVLVSGCATEKADYRQLRNDGGLQSMLQEGLDATAQPSATGSLPSASAPLASFSMGQRGYVQTLIRFSKAHQAALVCDETSAEPKTNCAPLNTRYVELGVDAIQLRCARYFEVIEEQRVKRATTDNQWDSVSTVGAGIKTALKGTATSVAGIWLVLEQIKPLNGWISDFTADRPKAEGIDQPELLYQSIQTKFTDIAKKGSAQASTSLSASTSYLTQFNRPCTPLGIRDIKNPLTIKPAASQEDKTSEPAPKPAASTAK